MRNIASHTFIRQKNSEIKSVTREKVPEREEMAKYGARGRFIGQLSDGDFSWFRDLKWDIIYLQEFRKLSHYKVGEERRSAPVGKQKKKGLTVYS